MVRVDIPLERELAMVIVQDDDRSFVRLYDPVAKTSITPKYWITQEQIDKLVMRYAQLDKIEIVIDPPQGFRPLRFTKSDNFVRLTIGEAHVQIDEIKFSLMTSRLQTTDS